jgi:polar amino acid transport system permease protein
MPVLGNQIIQIIKDSAFLTIIAVPELTHEASAIQSTYYVPFAAFISAVMLYWILCRLVELAVGAVERRGRTRR